MTAGRSETATPPNPTPPSNFSSLGETPPTSPGLVPVSAGLPGEPHLFAPATGGLEHECAGTEVVDPITGTVSTDGPYTTSPNTDHPSSGGAAEGETPAWVPANAVTHIDLVGGTPQGRAWVAGTGEVAVDTLLGADARTNNWDTTSYSSSKLTANGYVQASEAFAPIGAAYTKIMAGCTMTVQYKYLAPTPMVSCIILTMFSLDAGDGVTVDTNISSTNNFGVASWNGPANENIPNTINPAAGALNKVAVTTTGARIEAAANGETTVIDIILNAVDKPPGNPYVAVMFDFTGGGGTGAAIQSITLYDPLPSTAGLSELSEVT